MLPSIIQENFLSISEIDYISETIITNGIIAEENVNGKLHSINYEWNYYSKEFIDIYKIFEKKLNALTNKKLFINNSHILQSLVPYIPHTDFNERLLLKLLPNFIPAYTIIIPLDNYDTNTVVFNQTSDIKEIKSYIERNAKIDDSITNEFYEQYLTHCDRNILKYLSLKEVFRWRKGSIHACDRRYFHCSDNYIKNGLSEKKAIIMWTDIQKNAY